MWALDPNPKTQRDQAPKPKRDNEFHTQKKAYKYSLVE